MSGAGFRAAYADSGSGQVHYVKLVRSDPAKVPVVFLNPRSRSCRAAAQLLAGNRPALIIDIPAFGLTAPPAAGASMLQVGEMMSRVLEQEGLSAALLVGFHTGAKVAAALTVARPQLVIGQLLGGKPHSLIPDRDARNRAIEAQVVKQMPDVVLVGLESFVADDASRRVGMSRMYEANFAFDFAGAIAQADCPTRILEFISAEEEAEHGRQGESLAAFAKKGSCVDLPEQETMGTDLYVGTGNVVRLIDEFAAGCGV